MADTRSSLMLDVQRYGFVAAEAAMFLDTHPDNRLAMKYYTKYMELAKAAQEKYEDMYGPISHDFIPKEDVHWAWIDGPWPWEGEA